MLCLFPWVTSWRICVNDEIPWVGWVVFLSSLDENCMHELKKNILDIIYQKLSFPGLLTGLLIIQEVYFP